MNCFEFRQFKLSDPYSEDTSADTHRDDCDSCQNFEIELADLDNSVHQALNVAVPEGLAARIMLNQSLQQSSRRPTRRFGLGIAASFLVIALVSAVQYLYPGDNSEFGIEQALMAHAEHRPHEFYGADHEAIDNATLSQIMSNFNVQANLENVVYASVCPLNGESAAHLVIKDGEEQYTVMLIPDKSPGKSFSVSSDVWRGFISPHPAGALAVLADAKHGIAIDRLPKITERLIGSVNLMGTEL